jgi:hypothetical protein
VGSERVSMEPRGRERHARQRRAGSGESGGSRANECDELIAIFVTILKSSKDS